MSVSPPPHVIWRLRWRHLLVMLCSLGLVVAFWQAPVVQKSTASTELRGVWMTDLGAAFMYYTTRLDDAIAHLAKLQLNTLYPCVWNGGATLHPSSAVSRAGAVPRWQKLPRPDPLAGLVQQAQRQQLRLIPWFEYGLMVPPNSAIATQHPDWLTATQDGQHRDRVNGQVWLNPAHPQVQQFLTDLIVEVARRYPIDGIQLDDHFGLPVAFGYDAYTVERYRAEHGGQAPPADPTDAEGMTWRAAHLTTLMTKIAQQVRAVRPEAIISLSPNLPDFAYQNYLQDWLHWINLGLVDEVVVQVYRDQTDAFASELSNPQLRKLQSRISTGIGIYTGPFLSPKASQQIRQQVQQVRQEQYAGVSFFCWETTFWELRRSPDQSQSILRQDF